MGHFNFCCSVSFYNLPLKEKYNVMSVPCLVINEGEKVLFGKKSIGELLQEL